MTTSNTPALTSRWAAWLAGDEPFFCLGARSLRRVTHHGYPDAPPVALRTPRRAAAVVCVRFDLMETTSGLSLSRPVGRDHVHVLVALDVAMAAADRAADMLNGES